MRIIPRSLAFDMLFGSNKGDGHFVIDAIYEGFEKEKEFRTCKNCTNLHMNDFCTRLNITTTPSWACDDFKVEG